MIKCIIQTRKKLEESNRNFECAEKELIEYYSYEIKTTTIKLNYLIKLAKSKNIEMSMIYKDYLYYDEEIIKAV